MIIEERIDIHPFEMREFELMCPNVVNHIINCYETKDRRIIAELDDGSAVEYDLVLQSSRSAMNIDILTRKRHPATEEAWRKLFARNLWRMMRYKGFTQVDLSEDTGISNSSLTYYTTGATTPSAYKILLIARALGCSVDELVDI